MGFGSFDSRDDGEHNRVGLVEISKAYATLVEFCDEGVSLDGV